MNENDLSYKPVSLDDIMIEVSDDKMEAYIRFIRSDLGVENINLDYIKTKLVVENVKYGISDELINKAVNEKEYHSKYLVAKGIPYVKGIDAKLNYHVDLDKKIEPKLLEDGKVDFQNLDLIENVRVGTKLVTLVPEEDGRNGINVYDEVVPFPKPKKLVLPKGKNTEIDESGLELYSTIDGQVVDHAGKIDVKPIFEVNGDVDNSTGNINFVGTVIIKGNVKTGFKIEAGGNIEVIGAVEGAIIHADGDIVLDQGMQGMNKGELIAKGKVVAKFLENATVRAGKDVRAGAIMHSDVQCDGDVEVFGKKGLIVGGVIEARKSISAKIIGSSFATLTEIKVGVDHELLNVFNDLNTEVSLYNKEIQKIDAALMSFKELAKKNMLSDDKKMILSKLVEQRNNYDEKIKEIEAQIEKVREKLNEKIDAKVSADIVMYPGTQVTIGKCFTHISEEIKHSTLFREGADVRIGPYVK